MSITRKIADWLPAFALFLALIVLWQVAVSLFGVREYLLPSPGSVVQALFSSQIDWAGHIFVTGPGGIEQRGFHAPAP